MDVFDYMHYDFVAKVDYVTDEIENTGYSILTGVDGPEEAEGIAMLVRLEFKSFPLYRTGLGWRNEYPEISYENPYDDWWVFRRERSAWDEAGQI